MIVVGAGVVGLAIADELTRRGVGVEVFERNSSVASESSWAAAGILDPAGADGPGPLLELLRVGYPLVVEMVRRLETITGLNLGFRACGMLALALTAQDAQDLESELSWQSGAGMAVERLDSTEIRKAEPALDGPVRWGLWWPQAAQIDVTRLGPAYQRIVELQGGLIRRDAPVHHFLVEGNRTVGVETSEGKVYADRVVNAAGAWAGLDPLLPWSIPTLPVRGQIIQFLTKQPIIQRIVRSPRAYLVQRSPERLIAGTTVERVGYDKSVTEEGQEIIRRGAGELCSRLRGIPPETAWAGLRPDTPDHLPILGTTPLDGLLAAVGHFRNGILLAPLTGRLIADLVTRGSCSLDLSAFRLSRFLAKSTEDVVK